MHLNDKKQKWIGGTSIDFKNNNNKFSFPVYNYTLFVHFCWHYFDKHIKQAVIKKKQKFTSAASQSRTVVSNEDVAN